MRIEAVRHEHRGDRLRICARVVWEDSAREPFDLYFETADLAADDLASQADPFLVACAIPALRHGERRITVDGEVSPELLQGLTTVMAWMRHWFRPGAQLPHLELRAETRPAPGSQGGRAGFFFSGGVDSLATLRCNRLQFPDSHPGSILDGLLVFGLEIDQPDAFAYALDAIQELAVETGVTLVPVFTNVRSLDDDWDFYRDEFQGAILASVGHALSGRLSVLSIAATYDIANLGPWGSHPLVDPNFSTHHLRVNHDGVALSRLEKVRLLLDWPTALRRMRVCNEVARYSAASLNCGTCEKCLRTKLELLALGALDRADAFPGKDLPVEAVREVYMHDAYVASCYRDLVGPLGATGHHHLQRAVEDALTRFDGESGFRGRLKRADRAYLNGAVRALRQAFHPLQPRQRTT